MRKSILGGVAVALALSAGGFPTAVGLECLSTATAAQAIVGRPLTPVSVAGVARRTTRRVIRRTTIYIAALPPACTVVVVEGASLHLCGGTYYQPYGTQYVVVHID